MLTSIELRNGNIILMENVTDIHYENGIISVSNNEITRSYPKDYVDCIWTRRCDS